NGQLNILETAPLTDDRKRYLYTKICQHVEDPFKDILCPEP
ncbi:3161_t:CDS:1, partial [Entrophospora sp. SA101]